MKWKKVFLFHNTIVYHPLHYLCGQHRRCCNRHRLDRVGLQHSIVLVVVHITGAESSTPRLSFMDHCLWNDTDDDEEEERLLAPTNFDNYVNKQQTRRRRRTTCVLFSWYAGSAKNRQTNIYTDNTNPITSSNSCSRSFCSIDTICCVMMLPASWHGWCREKPWRKRMWHRHPHH